MQKLRMSTKSLVKDKSRYCSPHLELHSVHTPITLLTAMSESIVNLEGDVTNYEEGDEFY